MIPKFYHMSIHPRLILLLHREQHKPYKELLKDLDDDVTDIDIEIQLLQDIRDNKVYCLSDCDNKDERGVCLGHIERAKPRRVDEAAIKSQGGER